MHGGGGPREPVPDAEPQRSTTGKWDFSSTVLSLDLVFDAISHPRRRYFLYALHAQTDVTLRELAEQIATWEADHHDAPVENHTRQVYVSLYHTHIPKLQEYAIVDFDHNTGVVTPSSNADVVFAALAGAGRNLGRVQKSDAHNTLEKTTEP